MIYTSFEELKRMILDYNPKPDLKLIKKAYFLAEDAHRGQTRVSGEPFFVHLVEVAKILVELKCSSATIAAGLLHDIVEDTKITLDEIKQHFGDDVAGIVEGVTKIDKINFESKEEYKAENLRKVMLATSKDIRVILVKLADRLHNMRTLKNFKPEKQKRIAQETMDIYAPIAHKLGMWRIKGELEDLALRYLEPEVYQALRSKINQKREQREKRTQDIIKDLKKQLEDKGVHAEISGRAKYFYSIYKKMKKKNVDFNEIYDLTALRIITKTIPECYAALGVVHEIYKPLPGRFKDYIAVPKANGYQSLHTAVVTEHGTIMEVQIRTEEMHRYAEEGIAAHWQYHGTERDKQFDRKIAWLKQILDWKSQSDNAKEFIDTLKIDLFEKEIVVFTPKGDPISLPEYATPVDFAYMVHTQVGNNCQQAKVNNKIVPLDTPLVSGDIVEIITRKNAKPSRQWLGFVKTSKARSKIRDILGLHIEGDVKKEEHEITASRQHIELVAQRKVIENFKISKCCTPKPGNNIIGFYTKDKKLTIHTKECINIHTFDQQKKVDVRWKEESSQPKIQLVITVKDRVGLLAEILNKFAQKQINLSSVNTRGRKDHIVIRLLVIEYEPHKLKSVVEELRKVSGVIQVSEERQKKE